MPGTEPESRRFSQYSMQIECPDCAQRMIVHVGLTGDPKTNEFECVHCQTDFAPLLPGPMVAGPFVD
jgi:hypothetical protein